MATKKKAKADDLLGGDIPEERPFRMIWQGLAEEDDAELIMCQSNIEWEDKFGHWKADQKVKTKDKKAESPFASAADDRFPGWVWIGRLYHDGRHVVVPKTNVLRCLIGAGMKIKTGQGQETYKAHIAAGVQLNPGPINLMHRGKPVPVDFLKPLEDETDWPTHQAAVLKAGFLLDVRRVRLSGRGGAMIRVRPKFKFWHVEFAGVLTSVSISNDLFERIAAIAGSRIGLGDWRPSNDSPGRHGAFKATVTWL